MGPQNGIVGNDYPTELPQTQVDPNAMDEIAKAAKFSKTTEFKELKKHFESRIDFYKVYLPDGRPVITASMQDRADNWAIANTIIGEFQAVIDVYEKAAETLKDAASRRKTT